MNDYEAKLVTIPGHMREPIKAYIEVGRPVGHFLTALLSNDLMEAFGRADDTNLAAMRNWVIYLYNYAPAGCYGSPERVREWHKVGGLLGIQQIAAEEAES